MASGLRSPRLVGTLPPKRRPTIHTFTSTVPTPREGMIDCTAGKYEHFRKSRSELKAMKKNLRAFYEHELLDGFEEVETVLTSNLPDQVYGTLAHQNILNAQTVHSPTGENEDNRFANAETQPLLKQREESRGHKQERLDKIALNVNIIVNILLLALKGAAVALSSSVSLLASFVDSALDFLSTLIIWAADVAAKREDPGSKYPTGKKRFEPLGVLVFSVCMIASFTQVLVESLRKLFGEQTGEVGTLSLFGKITMGVTIAVKLVIWAWCARFRSSGIQALAQDAKNDVFFNVFSLIIPWVGELLSIKQLDPLGGVLLSIYIIVEWVETLLENFVKLSGRMASSEHNFRVLYLISRFKPVLNVSYLEIYHVGDELIVEVDVVLPKDTPLPYAHDVGETMQASIEALDLVSRAYVHLDYDSNNPAQHAVI
ncbi:unnamed protein product [Mycena citricolor]|uniref:Cation efflux protein transmembrane domain-containing protein n=1 Tax=Mycena citricolor TaxID=2018698 RepID=A0AAD2I0W3_9AGAR|nr:unnamed protein product [Mycena citricolor]